MTFSAESLIIFVGAGASAPFDYPPITGLRDRLLKVLPEKEGGLFRDLLDRKGVVDSEGVLQALELIDSVAKHGIGEMFTSSNVALSLWAQDRSMRFTDFVELCRSLRDKIQGAIFEIYQFRTECRSKFDLYSRLFSIVEKTTGTKEHSIYTTNYDRVMEEYCASSSRYELRDGFKINAKNRRNLWDVGSFDSAFSGEGLLVKLFKLHGSLNWKISDFGIEQVMPETRLERPTPIYKKDVLIYPGSKERPDQEPFRYLYDRLEAQLKSSDRCLVIGFSFRDSYLNRLFRDFVESGKKQLVHMTNSSMETIGRNLLEVGNTGEVQRYVKISRLVCIPRHFGDATWETALRSILEVKPF